MEFIPTTHNEECADRILKAWAKAGAEYHIASVVKKELQRKLMQISLK